MRILAAALSVFVASALVPDPVAAADATQKRVPYYASISASRARMRTGPARTYPASWLYQRQDLPIKVVAIFKEWRKVADPDGTEGWMQANLLSGTRTAIVHGGGPVELREKPNAGEPVAVARGTGRGWAPEPVREWLVPDGC
ncbi:SH3 domain-containing protein [Sphingomonas sp. H160509]|uniref:SH3 domain-containing protein n=1 Tax=Sphingomonas sp. H160509 TaxID=2955313 RepID=UPI003158D294